MSGDTISDATGSYGTKCLTAPTNNPSARYENRAAWTDTNGNLWFFGGLNVFNFKNDLWMYCMFTNQWIWVSGDSTSNPFGNWGTIGISSPANKPNGRFGAVGWTDNNGHLYFFGGFGNFNDLWKYTIDTTCGICPTPTAIQENNPSNNLIIFPNPSSSEITISGIKFMDGDEIILIDVLGKIIFSKKITAPASNFQLLISNFSNGIYFLQLKTKDGMLSKKVMVQH
jgi:hypothetical protein